MRKQYSKPRVSVEAITLDQPIAAGCMANYADVQALLDMNVFLDTEIGKVGVCSWIFDEATMGNDLVCYHSNVQTAFLS